MMTDYYDGVDSDDVVYGDDVYDYLVSHLDDLCICHWLFALITLNSFQHRDGYSNVLIIFSSSCTNVLMY